jgi:hypothetical protein
MEGAIHAVAARAVPYDLAGDGTAMAAHQSRHLSDRQRWDLLAERCERIPLREGDLVISLSETFLLEDFASVSDRPSSRNQLLHLICESAALNFGVKLARPARFTRAVQ